MKLKTCVYYLGVGFNHEDVSGDGFCLGAEVLLAPLCRVEIKNGKCMKCRESPYDLEE